MACRFRRNKFTILIQLGFLVTMVILVFRLSNSAHYLGLWAKSANETVAHSLTPRRSVLNVTEFEWKLLGGFRGTLFDDISYLRNFTEKKQLTNKTILRVGNFTFKYLNWKDGSEHLEKINCPVTNCLFTSNRSYSRVADALVISEFHANDAWFFNPKPSNQIWVAHHFESPYHHRLDPRVLRGLVNWTATYRLDSTISLPYGSWLVLDENPVVPGSMKNYAEGRTRKVAMVASNCKDKNGRRIYAMELGKYIEVHIYGGCGNWTCPGNKSEVGRVVCFEMLAKNYKFYLSFENSNCIGYITEKLHFNALSHDLVPIVMGARPEDYAIAAPPGSYIHVDDFKSPEDLGAYLNLLDRNDTLYNEYFRYKNHFKLIRRIKFADLYWCQLCSMLHLKDITHVNLWHDDRYMYERWWNGGCNATGDKWKTWKNTKRKWDELLYST